MKVIILCGGLGSRLSEETKTKPKPMVRIGKKPIVCHIMEIYKKFGFNEFILAAGYKSGYIKKYFKKRKFGFKVDVISTGETTLTGGRLLRLKKIIKKNETFMLTYGDGLTSQNIKRLLNFHISQNKIATVTAVRPPVRFGELQIAKNTVSEFKEKPQSKKGWINGGFFVFNYKVFDYIKNDKISFEKEPMEKLSKNKNLMAYKHLGFWKCMDNLGDKNYLEKLYKENKFKPWKK